jgi:hypothetical protein
MKTATIRVVLSLALSQNWPIHQLDVKKALLTSPNPIMYVVSSSPYMG